MASPRTHDDIATLCRFAESLATRRKERPATVHILLSLCSHDTQVGALLELHKLSASRVEAAMASSLEEDETVVRRVVQSARDIASRTRATHPSAHHLLLALLGERKSGAFGVLERCGVDTARLRNAAMQVAVGAVSPRRGSLSAPAPSAGAPAAPAPSPAPAPAPARPPRNTRTTAIPVSLSPSPRPRPPAVDAPDDASPPDPRDLPPATVGSNALAAPVVAPPPAPPPAVAVSLTPQVVAPPVHSDAPPPKPLRPAQKPRPDEARFSLDARLYPALSALGKNLSLMALRGDLAPAIGRQIEVERALDVLAKQRANCPVLVGPPGVGKSSTLRGLALACVAAPEGSADDRLLLEISAADLVAGTTVRGALAERFAAIKKEIIAGKGRVTLVVEDIQQLFSPDIDDEIGGELRASLARGELSLVGTATPEHFRRVFEQDETLSRRFAAVPIDEPTPAVAREIIGHARASLETHHRVSFSDATLSRAVEWTSRYVRGRALPDKALSVLDLAGARARRRGQTRVEPDVLAHVVAEATDVPVERLLEADGDRMMSLEQRLSGSVVGHEPMLARIARILRRNAAGLSGRRPIGTFLLLGPTGVGKTETARAIAKALFDSEGAMTRLDLSEYAEAHAVARLIGAPPGYVGHDAGGQLTEAVRRRPYQVVLLDEIEKANRDVLEAFLQVFDEGRLTDGRGRTVDFTNTVLVLTSNLGANAAVAAPQRSIGFRGDVASAPKGRDEAVVAAAREALPPELYNRIDEVLVFRALTRDDVLEIARRMLASLADSLARQKKIRVRYDDAVLGALLDLGGFDPELGARPLKRAIARHVEATLSELLLSGKLPEGSSVHVHLDAHGAIALSPG